MQSIISAGLMIVLACAAGVFAAEPGDGESSPGVSFHEQIRPLLQKHCQGCHQPARAQGKLDVTTFAAFKVGGREGEGFVAGKPEESVVIDYLTGAAEPRMPKDADPLSDDEIDLFRQWIAEGAVDDSPPNTGAMYSMESPPSYEQPPVISALTYSRDGKWLAVSGYHEVLIHAAEGDALQARLVGLSQRINALAFSPDGELLGVAGGSPGRFGEIQLWDVENKKLRESITVGFDSVYGLSFSPDSQRVAVGCADNTARVFDVRKGTEQLELKHHTDWVFGTIFSPDGKYLVTVSRDRAAKLSEADTGAMIDDINKLKSELKCIAGHPRQDQFIHAGDDGVAEIYKMHRTQARVIGDDFNLLRTLEPLPGPSPAFAVAYSADGEQVAVAGGYKEVRVHHGDTGKRIATLTGHEGSVYAVAFSPGGAQIATGGFDGKVRLYDIKSQKLIKAFIPVPLKAEVAVGN